MKASWLLVPCLVGLLALGEAPVERRSPPVPYLTSAIQQLDDAVARQDLAAAVRALDRANRAASASGRWEDQLEVGHALRRIEEAEGSPDGFDSRARSLYLGALARARQQGSLDGVFRAADALATLGDREGVEQSLRAAEALASFNPEAQADLRAFTRRLADFR
jgi:hypothetical protein